MERRDIVITSQQKMGNPSMAPSALRAVISQETDDYLRTGGKIEVIPLGISALTPKGHLKSYQHFTEKRANENTGD